MTMLKILSHCSNLHKFLQPVQIAQFVMNKCRRFLRNYYKRFPIVGKEFSIISCMLFATSFFIGLLKIYENLSNELTYIAEKLIALWRFFIFFRWKNALGKKTYELLSFVPQKGYVPIFDIVMWYFFTKIICLMYWFKNFIGDVLFLISI